MEIHTWLRWKASRNSSVVLGAIPTNSVFVNVAHGVAGGIVLATQIRGTWWQWHVVRTLAGTLLAVLGLKRPLESVA